MNTLSELRQLADATGFRPLALEKVDRLLGILARLKDNELSQGTWVLKGGTAINLFYLEVPRLSVDIDLNFVGVEHVDELSGAREVFEKVLIASCARENCSVKRAPPEHAGGKFRLRYPSLLGGQQNLEVDVSYVARVPLLGVEKRLAAIALHLIELRVPVLSLAEVGAGKFSALLSRGTPRDYFDALSLIELDPVLPQDAAFRVAFVCQIAAARTDLRNVTALRPLQLNEIETQLLPTLRVKSSEIQRGAAGLLEKLNDVVRPVARKISDWSDGERRFLDRLLDQGEIEPQHLTDDKSLCTRIAKQPMLRWKQKHIRKHRDQNVK